MKQYIDKTAVMAEIERIKKEECPTDSYEGRCKLLWFEQFLTFLNTIEVKDVDEVIKTAEDTYFAGSEAMRWKLIEKACNWMEEQEETIGISFKKDFIERFRKAMEDET